MLMVIAPWFPLEAAPIEVRLVEGTAHGPLLIRSVNGEIVGHGDFLQAAHRDHVECRLVLRFRDGSLHDETIAFSQQRVFTLLNYPAGAARVVVSGDAGGRARPKDGDVQGALDAGREGRGF